MLDKSATRRPNGTSSGIREVARVAGVSTATVSRVFNRPDSVKANTRTKVLATAKQLFYIPDNAAKALASQRSKRIGALIPTIDDSIFAQFVTSLQSELGQAGYNLILGISQFDAEQEMKELRGLIETGIDGVVLCGEHRDPEVYRLLKKRNIPYLLSNVFLPSSSHPNVGYDNKAGAAKATRHLLDHGHVQFGVIDFPIAKNDRAAMRVEGVISTLAESNLVLRPECHIERLYGYEDGRIGLRILLDKAPDTTAIFCGNDVLAIGALLEAQALGMAVPESLSIVGFDDLDLAEQIAPGLTTLNVPTDAMGRRTAETLLTALSGKPSPHATEIATHLIVRGSTGPAPR